MALYRLHLQFSKGQGPNARDSSLSTARSSTVILSAAKDLAADRDRPFAEFPLSEANGLRVTRGDCCSNGQVQFVQIEPCRVCECSWYGRLAWPPPLATFGFYLLRLAMSSSVVPLVTNSYNMAWPDLGRSTRPRRWIYSRLVLFPLPTTPARQHATSTPPLT